MFPSTDPRSRRRHEAQDDGFTLIEIVVALGVLTTVMVALLPQLIVGIKSTGTARLITQAKGITQGQLEKMRNLPYHIAPAAGPYVDVLDNYYRDLAPPGTTPACRTGNAYTTPATGWTGFVPAGSAARCDYEPATGAFYRKVQPVSAGAGIGAFIIVVDTQFLSGATPPAPVTPLTGYHTQTVGKDNPASSQIGVTATVLYTDRGTLRPVSTYTQIAERLPTTTRVRSEADARIVEVGSVAQDGSTRAPISLSAGLLNLRGAVSYASTAKANLATVTAGLATEAGEQASGASSTLTAPPALDVGLTTAAPGMLSNGGCAYACWGGTTASGFAMSSESGLPNVGTSVTPVQAMLSTLSYDGLSFGNSKTNDYREALRLTPPLVRLDPSVTAVNSGLSGCDVGATGALSHVTASGYLRTTATDAAVDPGIVESCSVGRTTALELFPTTFAPHGVVRIELDHASARCLVQGGAHTPTTDYDYRAVVKYYNGSGYTTAATVTPTQTTDPLEDVPLSTPVSLTNTLGDYVASWSSLSKDEVTVTTETGGGRGMAKVTLPGVVTIASQPVRFDGLLSGLDETSVVSLAVGALSCSAEDSR